MMGLSMKLKIDVVGVGYVRVLMCTGGKEDGDIGCAHAQACVCVLMCTEEKEDGAIGCARAQACVRVLTFTGGKEEKMVKKALRED